MNLMLKVYDTMMPEFIELARLLDRELEQRTGESQDLFSPASSLQGLHDLVLAWRGRDPVGCAALRELSAGVWEVKRVFVLPEYRGGGISRQIMERLEQLATEKGAKRLVLETSNAIPEAVALYTNMAYRIISNFGPYEGRETSLCFGKDLPA